MTWPDTIGLRAYEELDSSNAEARRLAAAGERGPFWIWAKRQSAGRGRRGRAWRAGGEDLTATLLLPPHQRRPDATPSEVATLSFAACLAVADMVDALAPGAEVALKWPNDVLAQSRKIAGVLLESESQSPGAAGGVAWLAIGIGVNIASAPETDQLEEGAVPSIGLGALASKPVTPTTALAHLAAALERWIAVWAAQGFAGLREPWMARAARRDGAVAARLPRETVVGRFVDLDPDGALVLETPDGRRHISAADVFFP
ncbi:MAG: biotin--[acetyl-CoA-carboxylase] ligase [Rhodobacteraceae bacterium]|nr:biotin--[acetyl-CoA-carboxylase] ligase [Paracoccaceae bacterium]